MFNHKLVRITYCTHPRASPDVTSAITTLHQHDAPPISGTLFVTWSFSTKKKPPLPVYVLTRNAPGMVGMGTWRGRRTKPSHHTSPQNFCSLDGRVVVPNFYRDEKQILKSFHVTELSEDCLIPWWFHYFKFNTIFRLWGITFIELFFFVSIRYPKMK